MIDRDELIERVERSLDDENHEQLCHCSEWPNDCVTYGKRRPWSYSHVGAIDAVLAAGYVKMPSREAIMRVLRRNRTRGNTSADGDSGATADLILALLAGEVSE